MADSFEQVRELSEASLRALIDRGRPEERVWAIWALALRSDQLIGELALETDPNPGVRRTLAVMFAGHGELELLLALARRDPAAEVRATAMALVVRFAVASPAQPGGAALPNGSAELKAGKVAPELIAEAIATDGADTKIAVLAQVFEGSPSWLIGIAIALLEDQEPEVRFEAFEALARANEPSHALAWLEQLSDNELRLVLMKWSSGARGTRTADRVYACAQELVNASRRTRRLFIEAVLAPSWAALAPVIGDDPTMLSAFAKRGRELLRQVPDAVLVAASLAGARRNTGDEFLFELRVRFQRIERPDDQLAPLLPDYVEMLERRAQLLDNELALAAQRNELDEYALQELEGHRDELVYMARYAARLLVH
ncbi:MAG: hypothetical protein QM831_45225 [Kofleriaceae bacterium]